MRVFLTKTGVYERNDDDEKKTTDRRPQHPLPLVSCFLGLGQINLDSPFMLVSAKRPKHTTNAHTRAHSHAQHMHTYIHNK